MSLLVKATALLFIMPSLLLQEKLPYMIMAAEKIRKYMALKSLLFYL